MIEYFDKELIKVLENSIPNEEIMQFINYSLSESDIDFIKQSAKEVLTVTPNKSFNCAAMCAIWAAIIKDHSKIPVFMISGHLKWQGSHIFYCKSPIPDYQANLVWDGHCWLVFGGLIADISLLRTLKNEKSLEIFNSQIITVLGEGKGLMCADFEYFKSIGLEYTPCYLLTEPQINGLINGNYSKLSSNGT